MTQDEDLDVLSAVRADQQGKPAEHAGHHQVSEPLRHAKIKPQLNTSGQQITVAKIEALRDRKELPHVKHDS